jgi:hypothetical protein
MHGVEKEEAMYDWNGERKGWGGAARIKEVVSFMHFKELR